jgi:hypothetical protein
MIIKQTGLRDHDLASLASMMRRGVSGGASIEAVWAAAKKRHYYLRDATMESYRATVLKRAGIEPAEASEGEGDEPTSGEPPKRKRGRPSKAELAARAAESEAESEE